MEYLYNNEWKELKKQKKYKEADEILSSEIAIDCIRAHNLFSDIKLEEQPGNIGSLNFGLNSDGNIIKDFEKILNLAYMLDGTIMYYEEEKIENGDVNYKKSLNEYEKIHKKILKCFEKELKNE